MTTRMQPQRLEAGRLLAWLAEVFEKRDAVHVEIVVVDEPRGYSSVQITLHDVPGPLAGFEVRPLRRG